MTASARAVHLLRCLLDAGVREVVLAPGSRSAPLALALHAADAAGDVRLHVRVDERCAGFLALGLSIGSGRPVPVVTTSGTAVGNLLPAVMEACHSGRRIVVVSADRPAALRGTGANQTTVQAGLFGRFAPCADLAVDAGESLVEHAVRRMCERAGPGHLNVQLDAPLVPPDEPWWPGGGRSGTGGQLPGHGKTDTPAPGVESLAPGPRTVVVAGDGAGPAARELAETGRYPLLAEPTSGARSGACALRTYRLLLGTPLGARVERVVVVGHPTLSRPVTGLLSRPGVEVLSVTGPGGVATDPGRSARHLGTVPTAPAGADDEWLRAWRTADQIVSGRLDDYLDALPEVHALQVAADVAAAAAPGAPLIVGSSNPIRDLDLVHRPSAPPDVAFAVANRGLSGIDGTISTALGVALARADREGMGSLRGGPGALALVGDLTFLHDSTGLLLGPHEPRPDLTVVVVNDDGGSIFALLEQGAPAYAAGFERVFATPTRADLAALCAASGTAHERVDTREALRATLAAPSAGVRVVEARVGRADRRATVAAIAALAAGVAMSIARSSLAMASGTTASRVLGVLRQSLLVLAIGQGLTANAFTTANTLPNVLYMLVAGGVLTSVLVPQLVKASQRPDGGREYTDRLLTLALGGLLAVTVIATLAAGWLVQLYAGRLTGSALGLATFFAVLTLPQIFFYGMYGLLGQVLNARGQFAAFGWAPALANVVAIAGLLAFMVLFDGHAAPEQWTPEMVWWFAGTATLSIVAQAVILLIPLWRKGFRYRPRFGVRGVGLGATSRVAGWAFAALLVSQLTYLVSSRVMWNASGDLSTQRAAGEPFVAGVAVWANALFVFMVPHSLVALSVFTALYPRIAAAVHAGDQRALRSDYARGLTVPAAVTVPASAALVVFALPLTGLLYSSRDPAEIPATALTLACLAPGILPFGIDVLNQRYLYAFEDGRKAFTCQALLTTSAVGITLLSLLARPELTVPIVAVGLVVSNVASAALGMWFVRRRIGRPSMFLVVRSWVRILLASVVAGTVAWGVVVASARVLPERSRWSDLVVLVVGGLLFGAVYYGLSRALHIAEVARFVDPIVRRLRRRSPAKQ